MKRIVRVSENILKDIDRALELDLGSKKTELFEMVIKKLLKINSRNDEAAYLIGYLYYLHPNKNNKSYNIKESEKFLKKALVESNDSSIIARALLYLGHICYDIKKYNIALKYFSKININDMPGGYLKIKTLEFNLCSQIMVKGLESTLDLLDCFINKIQNFCYYDFFPFELANVLSKQSINFNLISVKYLENQMFKIDEIGHFDNWFSGILKKLKSKQSS